MPRFLNTRKAISEIEDLIRNAGEKLILISPYLKLSKDFKELLQYRNSKEKISTIIFGKQELNPDEMAFLQTMRFVILKFNENLHAKCYLNEDRILITSLNLYEFSIANNKEMGVLLERLNEADKQTFNEAMNEVNFILETSQTFDFISTPLKKEKQSTSIRTSSKVSATAIGFCIRTGEKIPFNLEKPMTFEAFKVWNQFADPNYPEKYCHFSGETSHGETTYAKPIMNKNWKKAKEKYGL